MDSFHLLETPQRVAFGDQLRNGALMQRTRNQQNNVIYHVTVRDKVQESRKRLNSLIPQVLELDHEFFSQLVIDGGNSEGRRLVCQK